MMIGVVIMKFNFYSTTEEFEQLISDRCIVCFGAGLRAQEFFEMRPYLIGKIRYFIDNDSMKKNIILNGHSFSVKSFVTGYDNIMDNDILIVMSSFQHCMEMVAQIAKSELSDIFTCFASAAIEICDILNNANTLYVYEKSRVAEFIASRETNGYFMIDCGKSTGEIVEQFGELDEKARRYCADNLKKSDFKLYELLVNNHDMLYSPIKSCKYLLLMDTADVFHHGCSATCMAIRQNLLKNGSVFSVGYSTLTFYKMECAENMDEFISESFMKKWETVNKKLIERMEHSEHVIFNGETVLDRYSRQSIHFFYLLYYAKTVLKKKVSIINHSASPKSYLNRWPDNDPAFFYEIFKLVYQTIDNCYFREIRSLIETEEVLPGIGKQSFDCVPLYISNTYPFYKNPPPKREYILVAGGNNLPKWYTEFLYSLLRYPFLLSCKIMFIYSDIYYTGKEIDRNEIEIYRRLKDLFGVRVSFIAVTATDEWLNTIHKAKLLISGRFHHSISAFMLDTPFMAFRTDTRKMIGMLELIEKQNVLLPDKDMCSALEYAEQLMKSSNFFNANDKEIKHRIIRLAETNFVY